MSLLMFGAAWSSGSLRRRRAREEPLLRELARAGFEEVDIESTRVYRVADAKQFLTEAGIADEQVLA